MWIYTQHGFASIVSPARGNSQFVVRTRNNKDIAELANLLHDPVKILKTPGRDYAYRFFINKEQLAELLLAVIERLDYGNFKDRVKEVQGPERARTYGSLWATTLQLDPTHSAWEAKWDVETRFVDDRLPLNDIDEWVPRRQRKKNRRNKRRAL